jgi:hypothetical protein
MTIELQKLPKHLQDRVQRELSLGEIVIWCGQPNPAKFMRAGFALWLFFMPWTASALFWIAGASNF